MSQFPTVIYEKVSYHTSPSTFMDLLIVLGELQKSTTMSTSPSQTFFVRSMRYSS